MRKLRFTRPLSEVLEEHPDFVPQWASVGSSFVNERYGSVDHVVICAPDGRPLYDRFVNNDLPGTFVLPYEQTKGGIVRVGLTWQFREIHQAEFLSVPGGFYNPGEGILDAAARILAEDTGLKLEGAEDLGISICSPVSYGTIDKILLAKCAEIPEVEGTLAETETVNIRGLRPYSFEDLRKVQGAGDMKAANTIANGVLWRFALAHPGFIRNF